MKKYLLIVLLFLLTFCKESNKPETVVKTQNSAKNIFEAAALLSNVYKTEEILTQHGLDAYEVYRECLKYKLDYSQIVRFVRAIYRKPNEDYEKKYPKAEWYLSRLPLTEFAQMLHYFKQPFHKTFLDIGSGNGDKLYTALCLGFEKSYGVEYEKKLHEVAVQALKPLTDKNIAEIREGDATQLPDEYYSKIDFIYMYCPLILNKPEQAKLMHRILKNMRDNTLVYEAGFVYSKELKQLIPLEIEDGYRGFMAVKKEKGKYYYKIFITDWIEFEISK